MILRPGVGSTIAIIDYGMGNLASVAKAVEFLGGRARVTCDPKAVARSQAVIFPGVGAFGEAMGELKSRRLKDPIISSIRDGKPFLGLCLGLQLLFEASEESPGVRGLGVLPGRVRRFPRRQGLKVPHMGWNQVHRLASSPRKQGPALDSIEGSGPRLKISRATPGVLAYARISRWSRPSAIPPKGGTEGENDLLAGVPEGAFMYFVHSYYVDPKEKQMIVATTDYGCRFPSIVSNGERLWATQFHPEKSQRWGLTLLANFLKKVASC